MYVYNNFVNNNDVNDDVSADLNSRDDAIQLLRPEWQPQGLQQPRLPQQGGPLDLDGATWPNAYHNAALSLNPAYLLGPETVLTAGYVASPATRFEGYCLPKAIGTPATPAVDCGQFFRFAQYNSSWMHPTPPSHSPVSPACGELGQLQLAEPVTAEVPESCPLKPAPTERIQTEDGQQAQGPAKPDKPEKVPKKKGRKPIIRGEEEKKQLLIRQRSRNRVAAARCREKRRKDTKGLEQQASMLQERIYELQNSYQTLKLELITLTEIVFQHQDCGSGILRQFLEQRYRDPSNLEPLPLNLTAFAELESFADSDLEGGDDGDDDDEDDADGSLIDD